MVAYFELSLCLISFRDYITLRTFVNIVYNDITSKHHYRY